MNLAHVILLTLDRRCPWEHATEDYRPVEQPTGSPRVAYDAAASGYTNCEVARLVQRQHRCMAARQQRGGSGVPDHLAILIRQLVEAEQTVSAPLLGGGGRGRSAGSV